MGLRDQVEKRAAASLNSEPVVGAVVIGQPSGAAPGASVGQNARLATAEGRYTKALIDRGWHLDITKDAAASAGPKLYGAAGRNGVLVVATATRVLLLTRTMLRKPKALIVAAPIDEVELRYLDATDFTPDRRVFHFTFPGGLHHIGGCALFGAARADADSVVGAFGQRATRVDL